MDTLGGAMLLPLPNAKPETVRHREEFIIHARDGEVAPLGDMGDMGDGANNSINTPMPTYLAAAQTSVPAHCMS